MSQAIFNAINPSVTSGSQLATILNDFKAAMVSGMSGAARPTELEASGLWVDTSADPIWYFKIYDGTTDIVLLTINTTNNTASVSEAADSYTITKTSADAISPVLSLYKKRIAANGQVLVGDNLGTVEVKANTDAGASPVTVRMKITATDDFTPTASGSDIIIETTEDNSASLTEKIRIKGDGKLGLGVTAPTNTIHAVGNGIKTEKVGDDALPSKLISKKKRTSGLGQVLNNDVLASYEVVSVDDAGTDVEAFKIETIATQNHTATAHGTKQVFSNKKTGETAYTQQLSIGDNVQVLNTFTLNQTVDTTTTGANASVTITKSIHKLTNVGLTSINNIVIPGHGVAVLINGLGTTVDILNDVGGTAANRIITGSGGDIKLSAGESVVLMYDNNASRVLVIGGSGNIDTDSVQTLSNKTYNTPNFAGAFTMAQATTPTNPSAGNNKFYFKADGKLYTLDSAGNEAAVGSGVGGGSVNFVTNGNADDTSASIFVPYADAAASRPVDGTGGSPTVTTSITSTTPLNGAKSFLLTKPASNTQGQGWAVPFTVDLVYRAKSVKISADFIVNSGTFVAGSNTTDGDLIWTIYDVTNSQIIEPSNIKVFSNSTTIADKFEATFQTSATGASYRLLAHCATTSALAYELKVDNITVGPQNYVYGSPVTDAVPVTFTGSWTTNTTYSGVRSRIGDQYLYRVKVALTGAPNAATLAINLPSGDVMETSKLSSSVAYRSALESSGNGFGSGSGIALKALYNSTTSIVIAYINNGTNSAEGLVGQTLPITWAAGDEINITFMVPIAGLSSSVQMSNAAETRIVSLTATKNSGAQTASGSYQDVTSWTVAKDTHAAFNPTTGVYTIQSGGPYAVSGAVALDPNASGLRFVKVQKNGVDAFFGASTAGGTLVTFLPFSGVIDCVAGDTIKVLVFQSSGGNLNYGSSSNATSLSIVKVAGPSAIAASEKVVAYGSLANAQNFATSGADATGVLTTTRDTHGIIDTTNNWIKIPTADDYALEAHVAWTSNATGAREIRAQVSTNGGGAWSDIAIDSKPGNSATTGVVQLTKIRAFNSGDLVRFVGKQSSGGALSTVSDGSQNYFGIKRIR